LAQIAEQHGELHAIIARLVRENKELREEMDHLRDVITLLTDQSAETARTLRGLEAYVTAVNGQVLRQSREGTSLE
jgi:regulator of replication initiation timing